MKLFREQLLREILYNKISHLKWEINRLTYQNPENINIENEAANIFEDNKMEHIDIILENRTVDVKMTNINGNDFPRQYSVERGKNYECARIIYSFKKPHNADYLQYTPSYFEPYGTEYNYNQQQITFSHQTFYGNIVLSDEIKKEAKSWITNVVEHIQNGVNAINNDIDKYNVEIQKLIPTLIAEKAKEIINLKNQNNDLNDF